MDDTLKRELDQIARRERDWRRSIWLTVGWAVLGVVSVAVLVHARRLNESVAVGPLATLIGLSVSWGLTVFLLTSSTRSPLETARRLEERFPDLNARLLTAVEQQAEPETGRLNVFQQQVVAEAIDHARRNRWVNVLPAWSSAATLWAPRVGLAALVFALGLAAITGPARPASSVGPADIAAGDISVEPGDTNVERNTSMLVLARFGGRLPGEVQLLEKNNAGETRTLSMSKSLDDPVFATRIPDVKDDLQYAVRYGGEQTQWFKAKVFDYPELKRADADLKFPDFTKLADRRLDDVRTITAVEGTVATLSLSLNKPVAEARLLQANGQSIPLTADPKNPTVVTAKVDLVQSQSLKLKLVDADGRPNKDPATELAINVNPNRPPELKPVTPGRDVDVSPIQELSTGVRVFDDFGVHRVGITYGIAGRPAKELTLGHDVPGGKKLDVNHLISMEQAGAKPDELLSYYFWAEDSATDGSVRRTAGDIYFAEVRPFEEIFRQGEQPSEGEQRQQQQQQGGSGQQAEQLADLQKQIIAATWKIIRREVAAQPTAAFLPDVKLVQDSQASAREQAAALEERLTDARSRGFLKNVEEAMDRAIAGLASAEKSNAPATLKTALNDEQAAYQALLRMRAREFEVTRGNQQQGQSASSASSRRQQQLDQMELNQEQNRYQTQRSAAPQADNPQQRETRQILNRLKELAQRQEDLNRQMQELKSALEQTRDEKQREELQRQLARLRDQQEQQLRDTDELRDRMEKPENQESMAEARQQMEQTRENVRRAAERLQQQQVSDAAASGARAGEQLNQLRDQVRRESAGQLAQAMTDMRQTARELDDKQKRLSERMKQLDAADKPTLRDGDDRRKLAGELGQQKRQLDQLTEAMRKTVDEAENAEPLVSKQLYDALRQNSQRQTPEALDSSRQLLDKGFTNEARQAEAEAGKGITKLREGIEQAANGVLGDEAEALRRAKAELDQLANDLQREVDRNDPGRRGGATTRPTRGNLANGATTRPANQGRLAANATTQPRTGNAEHRAGDGDLSKSPATRPVGQLALGPTGEEPGRGTVPGDPSQGSAASGSQRRGREGSSDDLPNQRPSAGASGRRPAQSQTSAGQTPSGQSEAEAQSSSGESTGQQQGGTEARPNSNAPEQGAPTGEQGQPNSRRDADGQGQAGQSGQQSEPGPRGDGGPPQSPMPPSQGQRGQPGLRGQSGQGRSGEGTPSGQQPGEGRDPTQQQVSPPGDVPQQDGRTPGGDGGTNRTGREDAYTGDNDNPANGPLTGDNFQAWSDRLRDVEEMISDPKLRDRAAGIRQRARELRADVKKHAKQPNWDVVQNTIGTPLAELRDEVTLELLRRQSPDALVPLDRDNVPPQYAEQVKRYYERLGAGR